MKMNFIDFDESDSIVLERFLDRIKHILGYHTLYASWWYFDDNLSLRTFSYSDVLLKELGPYVRPLFFAKSDGIDFESRVINILKNKDLGESNGLFDKLKKMSANLKSNTTLFSMVVRPNDDHDDMQSDSTVYEEFDIFSDGDFVEKIRVDRWSSRVKPDSEYFLKMLYGNVIHDSVGAKDFLDSLSPGEYIYAVSSAVLFLQNAVEVLHTTATLLRSIGVKEINRPQRDRPRINFPDNDSLDNKNDATADRLRSANARGILFSMAFLEDLEGHINMLASPSKGEDGLVSAEWLDPESGIPRMVYSRHCRVIEHDGIVRIEASTPEHILSKIAVWDPLTLKDGRRSGNSRWGIA